MTLRVFLAAILIAPLILFASMTRPWAAEYGKASWYSVASSSNRTASGQTLDEAALTAAHKSLPFGARVRVTNRNNGRSVIVTINDRGPYVRGRIIDLTPAGKRAIGMAGKAPVKIERVGK